MNPLPTGVTRTTDPGGRDALRLARGDDQVLIALLGAQVLSWHRRGSDVLFTGSAAEFAPGKLVRGGVPLVFPWFGDHPTDRRLPAHGFARTLTWQLASADPGPAVVLTTTDDAATRTLWPHAFALELAVTLGDTLRLALTVRNPGDRELVCEEALHTYFAVGDVHRAAVHGLEGVAFTEHAAAPEGPWDARAPLRFRAETDRIFQATPDRIELRAPALQRAIDLTTTGARSAIVWTPWPAKAARLAGLAGDDWERFCCIESANVREHALRIPPGGSHTLALELGCRTLGPRDGA